MSIAKNIGIVLFYFNSFFNKILNFFYCFDSNVHFCQRIKDSQPDPYLIHCARAFKGDLTIFVDGFGGYRQRDKPGDLLSKCKYLFIGNIEWLTLNRFVFVYISVTDSIDGKFLKIFSNSRFDL